MMPEESGGTPWAELVAGASVLDQQALDRLEVPALLLDLPCRRIRAANQAIASLFAVPARELIGRVNSEVVSFADEEAMTRSTEAMTSGAIDGYRARRRITSRDGATTDVIVWGRAIDLDGVRSAAYIVVPIPVEGSDLRAINPPAAWAGPIVVGKADADWIVQCVSSDVSDVLGWDPTAPTKRSLLGSMRRDDADEVIRALSGSPAGGTTVRHVQIRRDDGRWVSLQGLFVRLSDDGPAPAVFSLLLEQPSQADASLDRLADLELRLRRIAAEVQAAGLMDDVARLPTAAQFPALNTLTARQWQIVVRLLRGERVSTIAQELFLSPGTVRNHLVTIFERFGVHSQAELITALRAG